MKKTRLFNDCHEPSLDLVLFTFIQARIESLGTCLAACDVIRNFTASKNSGQLWSVVDSLVIDPQLTSTPISVMAGGRAYPASILVRSYEKQPQIWTKVIRLPVYHMSIANGMESLPHKKILMCPWIWPLTLASYYWLVVFSNHRSFSSEF